MGCGCGGAKKATPMTWSVDLTGVRKADGTAAKFADGSTKKTYVNVKDANDAIIALALVGKVRPRPGA